jgi:hypothetical protein
LAGTLAADRQTLTDLAVEARSLSTQSIACDNDEPQPLRKSRNQRVERTMHPPRHNDRRRIDTRHALPQGRLYFWRDLLCVTRACMHFDGTPNMVYDARPGVGGERVPTVRLKTQNRAPQTDSSGL